MKPFITNSMENGRHVLRMQFEGIERGKLCQKLAGNCIVAYSLPEGQSLESSWQCRVHFDSGDILEFSSASTIVDGWQEIGSLNIKGVTGEVRDPLFQMIEVTPFCIQHIECLVYGDAKVFSECGIVLKNDQAKEIIIAAGVSPGSVSVKAPFSTLPFEPELLPEHYGRLPIGL